MSYKIKRQPSNRVRQSLLLRLLINDIDSFLIKWAETREELGDAFKLVYDEYKRSGYIKEHKARNMFFYIHHLLPDTAVLLMIDKEKVVSTLSLVVDSEEFGLPMDSIYRDELDDLRKYNRKVIEACALATSAKYRSANVFSYLFRQAYWHAVDNCTNYISIMVNPKHVQFYKKILLFEDLGIEKNYPRVGAPAIALRLDIAKYEEKLKSAYRGYPAECNLYRFVFKNEDLSPEAKKIWFDIDSYNGVGEKVTRYFYDTLPQEQKDEFSQKIAQSKNNNILADIR